ncbi:MAG: hypothetical protein ABIQ09_10260 [Jatrophihabitantaceae bacterium]
MLEHAVDLGRLSAVEPLRFHQLRYLDEGGDEVTVGRLDQGSFVVLPRDGAELIHQLEAGLSCADAASWYARTYGEELDIADFVGQLRQLGFLLESGEHRSAAAPVRWQRLGRAVFSPAGAACYATLVIAAALVMLRTPSLAPQPRNLFFTSYLSLLMVALFLGQLPLVLIHEAGHALAGRRLGLPSTLSVGHRFIYLVVQTNLDGLVSVPRRSRVLPIVAGMLVDVAAVAALTLAAAALPARSGAWAGVGDYLLALAFLSCLRVLWQFWFFLRTDIYYLVVTVLGCHDLQQAARQHLRNTLDQAMGRVRTHDPALWHPRDRAAARWYAWLLAAGYALCLATVPIAVLPMLSRTITILADSASPGRHSWLAAADSVLFLVLTLAQLGAAGWLAWRERSARHG